MKEKNIKIPHYRGGDGERNIMFFQIFNDIMIINLSWCKDTQLSQHSFTNSISFYYESDNLFHRT